MKFLAWAAVDVACTFLAIRLFLRDARAAVDPGPAEVRGLLFRAALALAVPLAPLFVLLAVVYGILPQSTWSF